MKLTLCGSQRMEPSFHKWNRQLSFAGHTVYSLTVFPSTLSRKDKISSEEKVSLDATHRRKISASDAIVVLNGVESYLGESTKSEISFALLQGKQVFFETWPTKDQLGLWCLYLDEAFSKFHLADVLLHD